MSGSWQAVQAIFIHSGGSWQQVFTAYTPVSAAGPGTVGGSCNNGTTDNSPCTASASATVTASNGTGSYSYTWSFVSGVVLSLSGQGTATATFTDTEPASNQTETSIYKCVVSDGKSSATVDVTIDLTFRNRA